MSLPIILRSTCSHCLSLFVPHHPLLTPSLPIACYSNLLVPFPSHPPSVSPLPLMSPSSSTLACCVLSASALLWSYLHPGTWQQIIAPEERRKKRKEKKLNFYLQPQLQFIAEWWMERLIARPLLTPSSSSFPPLLHSPSMRPPTAGVVGRVRKGPISISMPHLQQHFIMSCFKEDDHTAEEVAHWNCPLSYSTFLWPQNGLESSSSFGPFLTCKTAFGIFFYIQKWLLRSAQLKQFNGRRSRWDAIKNIRSCNYKKDNFDPRPRRSKTCDVNVRGERRSAALCKWHTLTDGATTARFLGPFLMSSVFNSHLLMFNKLSRRRCSWYLSPQKHR